LSPRHSFAGGEGSPVADHGGAFERGPEATGAKDDSKNVRRKNEQKRAKASKTMERWQEEREGRGSKLSGGLRVYRWMGGLLDYWDSLEECGISVFDFSWGCFERKNVHLSKSQRTQRTQRTKKVRM
jgi:hypothetical protein